VRGVRSNLTCHARAQDQTTIVMMETNAKPMKPRVRRLKRVPSRTKKPIIRAPAIAPAPSNVPFSAPEDKAEGRREREK